MKTLCKYIPQIDDGFLCASSVSRGNYCSQSDLYSSWTVLHPHYPHQPRAHALQTKDPGISPYLSLTKRGDTQKNIMSVMCKNGPSNSVFLYVRFFLGCMFHSTGIHIHDHEPNIHRAWLDEWRKAQSWWPLKCNSPNPTSTAAHCCTPPPLLWMGRRTYC